MKRSRAWLEHLVARVARYVFKFALVDLSIGLGVSGRVLSTVEVHDVRLGSATLHDVRIGTTYL